MRLVLRTLQLNGLLTFAVADTSPMAMRCGLAAALLPDPRANRGQAALAPHVTSGRRRTLLPSLSTELNTVAALWSANQSGLGEPRIIRSPALVPRRKDTI